MMASNVLRVVLWSCVAMSTLVMAIDADIAQQAFHDGEPHADFAKIQELRTSVAAFEKSLSALEDGYQKLDHELEELKRLSVVRDTLEAQHEAVCNSIYEEGDRLDRLTHELRTAIETSQNLAESRRHHRTQHQRASQLSMEKLQAAEADWARVAHVKHVCQVVQTELDSASFRHRALEDDAKAEAARDL
jgi:DNA repair exonuclease SbcCD ATPase subunit